jgi:hypothetical protein
MILQRTDYVRNVMKILKVIYELTIGGFLWKFESPRSGSEERVYYILQKIIQIAVRIPVFLRPYLQSYH